MTLNLILVPFILALCIRQQLKQHRKWAIAMTAMAVLAMAVKANWFLGATQE